MVRSARRLAAAFCIVGVSCLLGASRELSVADPDIVFRHGFEVATCANSVVEVSEACDDGNLWIGDGCSATCQVESGFMCAGAPSVCAATCGDGLKRGAEQCDDGNTAGGDGCSPNCKIDSGFGSVGEPSVCFTSCGDGIKAGNEQCDDGNIVGSDGFSSSC